MVRKIYLNEVKLGNVERAWGCAGFTGFKCGGIEYGFRDDEVMVRLMSETAAEQWSKVYVWADHVTRLDLQLTYDVGCNPQRIVFKLYRKALQYSLKKHRRLRNDVILGNDGGATVYYGTRQSTFFGRIYARGPKTKHPDDAHHLRFELQINKRLAHRVAKELAFRKESERYLSAQVVQFFRNRGLTIPIAALSVVDNSLARSRSDCDKRLLWLRRSVYPSCEMLIEKGRLGELVKALGLVDHVSINSEETRGHGPSRTNLKGG